MTSEMPQSRLGEILAAINSDDSDRRKHAIAEYLTQYEPRIRRRIRGKLRRAVRRLFDSQEIMSTVSRRLVASAGTGSLNAPSAEEFWSLVNRVMENSVIEKARVFRSLEAKEGEDSPLAHQTMRRLRDSERGDLDEPKIEIDRAMLRLGAKDQEILSLWLRGIGHTHIADVMEMTTPAVRQRWMRIRAELRTVYETEAC